MAQQILMFVTLITLGAGRVIPVEDSTSSNQESHPSLTTRPAILEQNEQVNYYSQGAPENSGIKPIYHFLHPEMLAAIPQAAMLQGYKLPQPVFEQGFAYVPTSATETENSNIEYQQAPLHHQSHNFNTLFNLDHEQQSEKESNQSNEASIQKYHSVATIPSVSTHHTSYPQYLVQQNPEEEQYVPKTTQTTKHYYKNPTVKPEEPTKHYQYIAKVSEPVKPSYISAKVQHPAKHQQITPKVSMESSSNQYVNIPRRLYQQPYTTHHHALPVPTIPSYISLNDGHETDRKSSIASQYQHQQPHYHQQKISKEQEGKEEENNEPSQYSFYYVVNDVHNGDHKEHKEVRNGDNVEGYYTVQEPDGTKRIVEYTANHRDGFRAVVKQEGTPNLPKSALASEYVNQYQQQPNPVYEYPK